MQRSKSAPYKKDDLLDDSYLIDKFDESELLFIGKGSFGKVFSALKKEGGEKIALKVIETNSQDSINDSENELLNLAIIKGHPNIITFLNFKINQAVLENKSFNYQLFLEMPLADCSLENLLSANQNRFSEQEALFILYQISLGLQHAHERKIAHLDLKPENILLFGGKIMIADWGGSLRLKSSNSTTVKQEFSYTRGYEAPELCDNYGQKGKYNYYVCDIYSLAMLLFRMCGISLAALEAIPKKMKWWHDEFLKKEILQKLENSYSKELLGLLVKMSAFEPEQRTTLKEIISYRE